MLAPRRGQRRAPLLVSGLSGINPVRFLTRVKRSLPLIETSINRRIADHSEAPRPAQFLAAHGMNVRRGHAVGDINADQNPPGARLIPRPTEHRLQQCHEHDREDRDAQAEQPISDGARHQPPFVPQQQHNQNQRQSDGGQVREQRPRRMRSMKDKLWGDGWHGGGALVLHEVRLF